MNEWRHTVDWLIWETTGKKLPVRLEVELLGETSNKKRPIDLKKLTKTPKDRMLRDENKR